MRVKGYPELRKIKGTVINVDREAYLRARKRRAAAQRIDQLESDVSEMKSSIDKILEILSAKA